VSRPTVDLWLSRFDVEGVAGLLGRRRGGPREQMSGEIRGRIEVDPGGGEPAQ